MTRAKEYVSAGTPLPRITRPKSKETDAAFLLGEEFHNRPMRSRSRTKKVFMKRHSSGRDKA